MKLKDVQGGLEKTVTVSARIPISYKEWLHKNKVSIKKLMIKSIEELKKLS